MFFAVRDWFPEEVVVSFPSEVIDRDTATGVMTAVHAINPPAQMQGTASATAFAAPSGVRVHWGTDAIVAGRRLRGRTFFVPTTVSAYELNGTIAEGCRTAFKTAADAFIDSGVNAWVEASVWSPTHGIQADITSASIPDEVAIMRSRRD